MAASILQIILRVTKEGTGDKEAAAAAKELKSTLKDLGLGALASVTPLAALTAGVTAAAAFTRQAVDETLRYSDQVRAMTLLTGQSAEQSSRLIQVMDDLKVTSDVLTMATKTLAKQGLTMNIETLAQLSEAYNRLGSGAEKTAFLVEKFGKSGMGMAEAMSLGGAKLREMNGAVEASLVMNQRAIDNAREYQRAIDNLDDAWMGVKITVGNMVIPELTNLAKWLKTGADGWAEYFSDRAAYNAQEQRTAEILRDQGLSMALIPGKLSGLTKATVDQENAARLMASQQLATEAATQKSGDAALSASTSLETLQAAEKAAADAAKTLSAAFQDELSLIEKMQSEQDRYAEKNRTLAEERRTIESDRAAYIAQYGAQNVQQIQNFDDALARNSAAAQKNAEEHDKASKSIVLGLLTQVMSADGLTQQEMTFLLEKGQAWGLYSATVVREAQIAIYQAHQINDAINGISSHHDVEIVMSYSYRNAPSGKPYALPYASGTDGWQTVPPGYPNDTFPIALTSGEKYAVIPAGNSAPGASLAAGGTNYSLAINYAPMVSLADASQLQAQLYPAFLSMIQRARSDGALR